LLKTELLPPAIADHKRVTIRRPDGIPLPELVLVSNRVLTEEAQALRAAVEQFGSAPQPGSPWTQDDEAMPLFSQASVSRVVSEAAVRFAWLMDPDISSAKRLVRGAVALHFSAEERSKGVRALPAENFDAAKYRQMLDSCRQEQESIRKLLDGAGMAFGTSGG
jgi:hypothetical protein